MIMTVKTLIDNDVKLIFSYKNHCIPRELSTQYSSPVVIAAIRDLFNASVNNLKILDSDAGCITAYVNYINNTYTLSLHSGFSLLKGVEIDYGYSENSHISYISLNRAELAYCLNFLKNKNVISDYELEAITHLYCESGRFSSDYYISSSNQR